MTIGRKKKALIHIAKGDLHLDEETYCQILKGIAGVESSTQLKREGFEKVMKRFQEMGFKGLLPHPYHPVPKGRLIPHESPQGLESITMSQKDFISYLLGQLNWDKDHYHALCQRIIKRAVPQTKRDGQKIIIGLMAILRKKAILLHSSHWPLPPTGRQRRREKKGGRQEKSMRRTIKIGLAAVLLISLGFISVSKEVPLAFVEMEVKGVRLDDLRQNPVVILTDRDDERVLPIWIGLLEANAIEKELKHVTSPRPLTHDLLHSILGRVHAKVKEVKIVELKNQTYYATLFLILNKNIIEVDARPSDAIIIALKSKIPIFVSTKILYEQGIPLSQKTTSEERYGIRVQELTLPLSSHFKFKGEKGVLVSEVTSDSVSEAAGMKAGDIITRINLKEVGSVREFGEAFDAVKPGDSLRVQFFRDEKFQEVNLFLKQ